MTLLGLQRRLASSGLSDKERQELQEVIKKAEKDMGLD